MAVALERLHAGHHLQLYVTYVRDFSGRAGRDWANATADRNGLGPRDVLLAIATHRQQYAVSAAKDSGFRAAQLKDVATTAIAPAVAQHDWAGAAIGAADGYGAVLRGEPVRPPAISPGDRDPGADGLVPGHRRIWLPVAVAVLACLTGLYLYARRAAGRRAARRRPVVATTTPPGLARMAQPLTPLPELDAEAARTLVETDDAVRTSAEELLFATAQLGKEPVRPFAEAVAYARSELDDAFRLRQQLDDSPYEDEDIRRRTLDEICSHCTSANRRLDAESAAFDRLRGSEPTRPASWPTPRPRPPRSRSAPTPPRPRSPRSPAAAPPPPWPRSPATRTRPATVSPSPPPAWPRPAAPSPEATATAQ
ncbi:TPM domain-containing protein [Streptomyces stramineus]